MKKLKNIPDIKMSNIFTICFQIGNVINEIDEDWKVL